MSDNNNNNNLIENLSDKVKAFLQSPDDFPVLEPHQWYNAIIKFVQTESIAALNKHYGNDGDQASISATGLSPAEQQQQAKERKIKKIDLEKELLVQIQLDLVHNLTNGTIEDYWLMYQQALREEHEEEEGDDNEGKTNGAASASKKTNGNTKKHASILDTIDFTRLTWPEIENVAWKNYRIYLEKKAEEEERQRKKQQQQQQEDEDEEHQHQHDDSDGDEVAVAPSEIVSPDSKNKQQQQQQQQQQHHATMLDEKTLREREKKIAKDEANINNENNNNNSNKKIIDLEDETVLEHLRNDALRPFRVQYERAFAILDKQLFDHTGSLIELDAFCQWSTVSFNPPYEQKEGEPNNRLGSIVNWLYLPNYAMNQDEDLVIDSYPLLREVRYIARDFPDCNLVKEGYCLEIFAHQTRDQFCGTMIQLADKPWSHSYPVIMSTFASSLRILAQTEKMVQIRDKRRKMKKLKEMTTTTAAATESRKDDDDATTTGSATTMSSTTTATTTTEPSTIKRSPNYYYGSTLIKILSRAKPSPQQPQQDHHQLAEKKKTNQHDNNNDNDDTTAAAPPPQQQIMGQEGNSNSEESSIEVISPVLSPRANDDDDDDENDNENANDNDQKDEKDLAGGERRYHLSKADAAEIACTMTRCAPPSDFAAVIAAVREYEIIPPKELNHNSNNTSTNSEKVPCYDIVIPSLHLPVVVFKDPSLGFLCRSSTLAEDWCVIQ